MPGRAEDSRSWARTVERFSLNVSVLMLRTLGVVLPGSVLWPLLWPIAMLRSAWELGWGGPTFGEFRRISGPPLLPPGRGLTLRRLLLGRTQLNLAKLLFLWPEKLASGRGVPCRIVGADRLAGLGRVGSPALLLTLHFGPTGVFFNWLRARGYPVAVVAMKGRRRLPWYRRYLSRVRDAPNELVGLPSLIEVGRVREMRDHLDAGGLLMVAVDGGHGRHSCSPVVQGLTLSMSTGALRIAALTGAVVIPCLIRSGPLFSLTIHLGEPLAVETVANKVGHPAACQHLLREFLTTLAVAPEECSFELLDSLGRSE